MNTSSYLYLVLVPVAQAFREKFDKKDWQFSAIRDHKRCRVKFVNKKYEKQWQDFCVEHELKNDLTVEY